MFFLGRGVYKAAQHPPAIVRLALSRLALTIAVVGTSVSFFLIDRGQTTTTFMLDLGDQPSAAAYSMIQFIYYAVVLSAMGSVAAGQLREFTGGGMLPPLALVTGSALGVLLSIAVITMDVAHVAGDLDLLSNAAIAYGPLYLSTFVFLCLGFAGQPAAGTVQALSRGWRTKRLIEELTPLWLAATTARPGISTHQSIVGADDSEAELHRKVVEIRDAAIDARVTFEPGASDRHLLGRAERHLLRTDVHWPKIDPSSATSRRRIP